MADKLIVRDFGPIKNAELDIKKTTVLIGPQGSGKSTLAKLVATSADTSWYFMINGNHNLRDHLSDYGIDNYRNKGSFFSYENDVAKIEFQSKDIHKPIDASSSFKFISKKNDSIISEFKLQKITNDQKVEKINKLIYTSLYIPSERTLLPIVKDASLSLQLNKIPIPVTVLLLGNQFEIARKNIHFLNTLLPGVNYQYLNGQDVVSYNDKNLDLSETASGYQSLIPMQLIIENLKSENNKVFIIEEPEQNLYPPTQKSLVRYLTNRCTKRDNKLILTTHSPYVLSSLNNLLFAYKVAQKHPEQSDEISAIIPKDSWLNPDEFAAYFVADGTVRSIVNPKTGLISENELDGVSENIGDEFDALMEIYSEKANEGRY